MSKAKKFVRNNLFLVFVAIAYIVLAFIRPQTSVQGLKESVYYIKEMLMIMPAIFVLTALLDTWVPTQTIIKYLGGSSGAKGVVLSFVLGSISGGPIYAAFPFCIMLHKKGASIKNIVIILSSWAVVKIPMLLNEAKFLGIKFMAIRWVLTIIAILIFSWITGKIVKDSDIPQKKKGVKVGVSLNRDACMGCTVCVNKYPELFEMGGKKATVLPHSPGSLDKDKLKETIAACPVKAIEFHPPANMKK